jgi:microcystin-dependent protein
MAKTVAVPVGTIVAMLASGSSPPPGWLLCDGREFKSTEYPDLARILPNNVLPDLQGYTLIGAGKLGGETYVAQRPYGAATHKITLEEMPSHQHYGFGEADDWPFGAGSGGRQGSCGGTDWDNRYYGSSYTGGAGKGELIADRGGKTYAEWSENIPMSLMQPSYAINYFIFGG